MSDLLTQLPETTLVFLISDHEVLLGYKKTGFGQGKYVGIGGKVEHGESVEEAAIREVAEEIKVSNPVLNKVAELTFLFPDKPSWQQRVHAFICYEWEGKPQETIEIKPEWFNRQHLPLSQMWDDAKFWLSAVLQGHTLKGTFIFGPDIRAQKVTLEHFA